MVDLKLTDKQARIVSRACEFYSRIVLGQFNEIILELVNSENIDAITDHRSEIEELLFKARDLIYPELHGRGHSYGVGKFDHADRAYDVYQALRVLFGDSRQHFSYYKLPDVSHYYDPEEEILDASKN